MPWTGEIVAGLTGAKTQKRVQAEHAFMSECINETSQQTWDGAIQTMWQKSRDLISQVKVFREGVIEKDGLTLSLLQPIRICGLVHSKLHQTTTFMPFTVNIGNYFSENTEGLMEHPQHSYKIPWKHWPSETSCLYAQYRSSVMSRHGDVDKLNKKPKINQSKNKGTEIWSMGERRLRCKSMCICLQC